MVLMLCERDEIAYMGGGVVFLPYSPELRSWRSLTVHQLRVSRH
jgi:hypothetical protein